MKARLDSIQILRAIAATAVVLTHTQGHVAYYKAEFGSGEAWLNLADPSWTGQCGVDIFFVISGFIIALVTDDLHGRKGAIKSFAQKRLIRILPSYWLWTSVVIFLLLFFPWLFSSKTFDLKEVVLSLLLIPYSPPNGSLAPLLIVGWTLSYEMYFYMLTCLGLLFSRKKFIIGLGAFFLITTVIFPQNQGPVSNLTSNMILWEFYAGLLLFELYKTGKRIPTILSLVLSICAIIMFHRFSAEAHSQLRFMYWGVPALILAASFVLADKTGRVPPGLVFLGDSSYSIYLTHVLVLSGIGKVLPMFDLRNTLPPDLRIILLTCICVAFGCLIYVITERPMLNYLGKYARRQSWRI